MALTKLGFYISEYDLRNSNDKYGEDSVVGISTQKTIIHTKADLMGVKLTSYKLLPPNYFAYVSDTSRRGDKMSLCYNTTNETFLVSSISTVFYVKNTKSLSPEYLFMYFNRPEFDRYSRFNSWGSARETFTWEDMCDIDIELPPLSIQQKYVDVYNSMLANQKAYERGLDDLELAVVALNENLRKSIPSEAIGKYITEINVRNTEGLTENAVRGLATNKEMIPTKANMDGVGLSNYKIVRPRQIAYVSDTSRRGDKISLGINDTDESFLVSSISTVFETDVKKLLPEYLMIFLTRSEFDRYARFHSWGSARETFDWNEMCNVQIPIPDVSIQKSITDIFACYVERKRINEKLKAQIKDICPILIKGSISEAIGETING